LAVLFLAITLGCAAASARADPPQIQVVGVDWQWTMLLDADGRATAELPNTNNYVLALLPDGSVRVSANCKAPLTGTYELNGNQLALHLPPPCPEAKMFVQLLGRAQRFTVDERGLVLHLRGSGGAMVFRVIA